MIIQYTEGGIDSYMNTDHLVKIERVGNTITFWGIPCPDDLGDPMPSMIDQIAFTTDEEARTQAETIAAVMSGRSPVYRIKGNIEIQDSNPDEEVKYWN